jgi:putative oxygen-independent coproporphyrinogen III oxidase
MVERGEPEVQRLSAPWGVYIHVPFCRRKCRYCDFCSREPGKGEPDRLLGAVLKEARGRADAAKPRFDTVYVGGGTPSLLGAERLKKLLDGLRACFDVTADAEITVEVNPVDVTPELASGLLSAGFNRVSVGVQSVIEDELRFLGRLHRAPDGPLAVETLRDAGFEEIGIDLIYGLPKQTPEMLRERIELAVESCRPTHVSAYQLTYAEGTPLWRELQTGRIRRLTEDEAGDLFVCAHQTLAGLGYPAYEVSNFSLDDAHRSRHNSKYWHHVPYVGLGPSAHSFDGRTRLWNVASTDEYAESIEAGGLVTAGSETLTDEQLRTESIMLALRTSDGLDRSLLGDVSDTIDNAVNRGLLIIDGDRLRPTLDGLAVADGLAADLA